MSEAADNSPRRQRGRPWPKGVSGNPRGPGTGSRNRASLVLDHMADGEAEAVLASVLTAAKAGDMAAAKLLLDRIWASRKGRPTPMELPPVRTPEDLLAATSALIAAVAAGDLTAEEAQAVSAVLTAHRQVLETVRLEQRIAALEAAKGDGRP
jgi:hypothetical protein